MKPRRILQTFPWHTALVLALGVCLPALTSWAWFSCELPPLQRYYLRAYWEGSETADQPGAVVQIQWLELAAPDRKSRWPIDSDVVDDPLGRSPLVLSSNALREGWTGIEESPPERVSSATLEDILRTYFYDGERFRQIVREPSIYGVVALLFVLLIAWMIRDGIESECRDVWRVIWEPESACDSEWDSPCNRPTITERLRMRIAQEIATLIYAYKWCRSLSGKIGSYKARQAETLAVACHTPSSLDTVDGAIRVFDPGSSAPTIGESSGHLVFPGSSPSYVHSKDAEEWHESEWID